jgi:hypothetical protein
MKMRTSATLEFEHPFLERDSAGGGKAAHSAVGSDDAMAWDHERKRVCGHYASGGSARAGTAPSLGQFGISCCLAYLYVSTGGEDLPEKGTETVQKKRYVHAEIHALTFEIRSYLLLKRLEEIRIELSLGQVLKQPGSHASRPRPGQTRPAQTGPCARQAKIAPVRLENHVF